MLSRSYKPLRVLLSLPAYTQERNLSTPRVTKTSQIPPQKSTEAHKYPQGA
jgi:hypothetical protein